MSTNEELISSSNQLPIVSVIIPVHNMQNFLLQCLESVLQQTTNEPFEISIFDDSSTDNSLQILQEAESRFTSKGIKFTLASETDGPKGPGYAKNRAVEMSSGEWLCFLDPDDYMFPERIETQLEYAKNYPNAIIGSNFVREPEGSTWHYTQWCNSLTLEELYSQQFRECTIIQPTWLMSRGVFNRVGGYAQVERGEDLIFFHYHLQFGGELFKIDKPLVIYRHRFGSESSRISRRQLIRIRLNFFEERILNNWDSFSIWGAGRDGRNFYNDLQKENKLKVIAFCDINPHKLGTTYLCQETKRQIPIIHFSEVVPPLVLCVAMGRTNGEFEENVRSMEFKECVDYWHFI